MVSIRSQHSGGVSDRPGRCGPEPHRPAVAGGDADSALGTVELEGEPEGACDGEDVVLGLGGLLPSADLAGDHGVIPWARIRVFV